MDVLHVAGDAMSGVHVAEGGVLPAGNEHGEIFFRSGHHPGVLRIDLVGLLDRSVANNLIHKLMRIKPLVFAVLVHPMAQHSRFDPPHRLSLGDARVRDAIHVTIQQRLLVFGSELPVMRHLFVMGAQRVLAEIIPQISPHGVDVIGIVLGVVIFNQERWALNAIIVALSSIETTCPGKMNLIHPSLV